MTSSYLNWLIGYPAEEVLIVEEPLTPEINYLLKYEELSKEFEEFKINKNEEYRILKTKLEHLDEISKSSEVDAYKTICRHVTDLKKLQANIKLLDENRKINLETIDKLNREINALKIQIKAMTRSLPPF